MNKYKYVKYKNKYVHKKNKQIGGFYLEHIILHNDPELNKQLKLKIIEKCNINFVIAKNEIIKAITNESALKTQCKTNDAQWIDCETTCSDVVRKYINKEILSTVYILSILSKSVIYIGDTDFQNTIEFSSAITDIDDITGIWEHDKQYFTIKKYGNVDNNKASNGRLIMGFGPSASGKTYWAKNIIKIFSQTSNFPQSFISIDGGIYRENSKIYNITKDAAQQAVCAVGFSNLVLSSFSFCKQSLFSSDVVKSIVTSYLAQQSITINLYVPETLGGCINWLSFIPMFSCYNTYTKYVDITNDQKWIGLLIWQHKEKKDCDKDAKYKCFGCTESGKQREKQEGKMYSNNSWETSMLNGEKATVNAPGGSYKIHNSGGEKFDNKFCLSIIENLDKTKTTGTNIDLVMMENQTAFNFTYIY